ncbi:hypothetical protein [Kribbella sp. NBC_00889]|uniref:hypothetical protein n=1 Tax=Kribbella sp. NBC_00889 TaxID=2975974 RepID=UPI00386740AC|nr:hypothetical protein OG817_11250 [Kribbella sp. NBC_00889]
MMTTTGDTAPVAPVAPNNPTIRPPDRRQLRTFAFDPMSTRLSGRFLGLDVPFEADLLPGPDGSLVQVVDYDATRDVWYEPLDLNDPAVLAQDGLRPAEGDPRAHQQIVYAVATSVIERVERFVGRRFRWRSSQKLRLVPHAFEGRNAFFDPKRRAVLFGYYQADRRDPGPNLPGQVIFTCLSTDIVAHEVTHAILHRLRQYYAEPTNPDVFAWHEAFADLVALFQHFVHRDVVCEAVATTSSDLRKNSGLLQLAREFGESTGRGAALRSAIGTEPTPQRFLSATEPHERGACFVAAVFDAYLDSYKRSIGDLIRIATGGTGILPAGELHPDLVERVADEAVKNADRLLGMVVRAMDYLPVVDVCFGDVVRAIVTADRALYPDDAINLRGNLVEAMRRRGIYPEQVASLSDVALEWPPALAWPKGAEVDPNNREALDLNDPEAPVDLRNLILLAAMDLDPGGKPGALQVKAPLGSDPDESELGDPGEVLFQTLSRWARLHAVEIGLDPDPELRIALTGIHVAYRQAADGQPRPEVAIQLTQRRPELEDQELPYDTRPKMRAGTVLIAGVDGRIEHMIAKPLPFKDAAAIAKLPLDHPGRDHHDAGVRRLAAMTGWGEQLDIVDALSEWTDQPSVERLTFAAIHAEIMNADRGI